MRAIKRIVFGLPLARKMECGTPILKQICDNQRKLNPEIDAHLTRVEADREEGVSKVGNLLPGTVISLLDGQVIKEG